MRVTVSGLINLETTLRVRKFPINYYPIDYPFFGVKSDVAGVAYNVAKALGTLGDEVRLMTFLGRDEEGGRILARLEEEGMGERLLYEELGETPASVVLYDGEGRRQIYCDLKDVQEQNIDMAKVDETIRESDLLVLCNTNFNRPLLGRAKELELPIATDVHVLGDIEDAYNREFMEYADILFFSDEGLPESPERFLTRMKERYPADIMAVGLGAAGALLYHRLYDKMYRLEAARLGGVVNTVGAGDALFSCFLHYYGKGYPPLEALIRAELFAALKIRSNGAANGFGTEAEVESLYAQNGVTVRTL